MILVYLEEREKKIKKSSVEALSEGKRLADQFQIPLEAVLIGSGQDNLGDEALKYGVSQVYLLDNSLLNNYSPSGFSVALSGLVQEIAPEIIIFSATSQGKDLAPRLAARLGVSLASDCIEASCKEGELEVKRPIFAGKAIATFAFKGKPAVVTLRPNVFSAIEASSPKGDIVKKEVEISEDQILARVDGIFREEGAELDVTEAEIIVSGGRGMKSPENFNLLRELTEMLPHSAVGASRSAVDSGWIDHQHQVGQTGKTVSPNLYIAFGISGAIQHLAGMSSSKFIVAVNKDPEAPIFKVADFGIVGDLFQVIPPLKEELKKILSE